MALKLIVDTLDGIAEAQQALYTKAEDGKFRLQVEGLEDTKGLKSALEKERTEREDAQKKLKEYDGVDLEEYRKISTAVANNKELQLIKDGKIEELKALWSENMTKDHQKILKKMQDDNAEAVKKATSKASRWEQKVLDNALRDAAEKAGVHSSAIEDVLFQGRVLFTVDDNGDAVFLRDGKIVVGKDGKSPMQPSEWLEQVRDAKPHWFPASGSGSGAQHTTTGGKNRTTIKRTAFEQLNPIERREAIKAGTVVTD